MFTQLIYYYRMSLKVLLLVVSLVSQCCTAPQRRNWTPQAILYLKGARHGSVLERPSRREADAMRLVTHNQTSDGRRWLAACFLVLELLQRAVEEGGGSEPKVTRTYAYNNSSLVE
ncbi:spexin-like [Nothobranchius furzeri]|uniref:Spexin-like n=1 Tax=Nothobranchius furzeri TaxID=105023 RepID=A0A9D3BVH6_NOTFU|nr:spexin-like [Nothobranchius furzeri]